MSLAPRTFRQLWSRDPDDGYHVKWVDADAVYQDSVDLTDELGSDTIVTASFDDVYNVLLSGLTISAGVVSFVHEGTGDAVLECIIGSRKVRVPLRFTDPRSSSRGVTTSQSAAVYDIAMFYQGLPSASDELMRFQVVRAFSLPTDCSGSACSSRVAATADVTLSLRDSGVEFGTIVIAGGGTTSVFSSTAHDFAVGDTFEVVCLSTDATLEDVSATFVGVL